MRCVELGRTRVEVVEGHNAGAYVVTVARLDSPVVTVTVGVLALQGDVREHVHALTSVGAHAVPVRRERELDAVDALVIPGGESTTIDKLLRAFELFEPVQDRLRAGMPAYGSCAGMILLADRVLGGIEGQQTLGGVDVTVRRNAFGRQVESFETELDIEGIDGARARRVHPGAVGRGGRPGRDRAGPGGVRPRRR